MTHRRRRVSRVLLAVLGLTIAVGLFTYVHKLSPTKAAANTRAAAAPATSATAPDVTKTLDLPITRAPEPTGTQQPQPQPQAQSLVTSPVDGSKPHVTEAPTVPPPGESAPHGGVTIVATGPKPFSLTGGAAAPTPLPAPTRHADKSAAAPSPSQKVTIQPYVAPAGSAGSTSATPPAPTGSAAEILAQARAKMQADKMLEARDLVNSALASGRILASDAGAARQLLAEINQTVVFSTRRFADDKWGGTYSVQPGDRLDRIGAKFGITPALLMKLNGITDARRLRAGATIKVLKGPFHAVVTKNTFRLDLYLGAPGGGDSVYVTSFPVGLGKDDSTPEGKWLVEPEKKIKNPVYYSPRGQGIIDADDPKNPLGEFWIGLVGTDGEAVGKQSYGIHGTIEPDSIGKQSSMGCVRMRNDDVAVVFDALVEGKSTVLVLN